MDLMHMWEQMGWVAKVIGVILIIMSMISFGVAIERIFTFSQARKQSKLYAPQVAKHLKEGRLKDAIAISSSHGESRVTGVASTKRVGGSIAASNGPPTAVRKSSGKAACINVTHPNCGS